MKTHTNAQTFFHASRGVAMLVLLLATALPALAETFTFNASVDSDFLNTANWSASAGGTPTPGTMGAADTYVVAANAQLGGTATVLGALSVNAGVTLTVAVGGVFTVGDGAVVTVANTGVLSNYGTVTCQAGTELAPTSLTTGTSGGVVNQAGATFTRQGTQFTSVMGGHFVNHGSFDESGGQWLDVDFENSATGTAVINGNISSGDPYTSWINAGLMTSSKWLGNYGAGNTGVSTFSNSGTLNLPSGSCQNEATTNSNSGTLNVAGRLGGLVNTGTVNLTGPAGFLPASGRGDFTNSGTINQGAYPVTIYPKLGAYKIRNQGTWTGSGGLNFFDYSTLSLEAGTLTSDGPWTFSGGSGVSVELSGGTLAGSAALSLPAAATGLKMNGGNLAASLTTAAPVSVTADSTVSGTLTLDVNGSLAVNAGVTLTVAVGGAFTVGDGAVVTVGNSGVLSNYGTVTCLASTGATPTSLTTGTSGGVVNQAGATFTRQSSSELSGHFVNHGSFDEVGGQWLDASFENSVTGTAVIRGSVSGPNPYTSWTNAGLMTSYSRIGNSGGAGTGVSTFSNSGTLNLPSGSFNSTASSNSNSGTLNVAGKLGGLVNTGTVNLTGPATFQPATGSGDFTNQGTINQGAYAVTISLRLGAYKVRNQGTWTGSGGLNFFNDSTLSLEAGTLTSDGPWSFTGDGSGVSVELSGGTLAGSAALTLPATATGLKMNGGNLAASLTTAAPVSVTADSTVSGALTLDVNGSLAVNAGVTLTVAVGGAFTVGDGAVVTVGNSGVLSNYGTVICLASTGATPTSLTTGTSGGVVNQAGATFTRQGGFRSGSEMGGHFVNHGSFDEVGGLWLNVDFENSATGTASINAHINTSSSWTNAGLMTATKPIGNKSTGGAHGTGTFSNSGTLNLPSGSCGNEATSNSNSGTLNVAGRLGGLVNTGTVNLTGPATFQPADVSADFNNQGTINQGAYPVTISFRLGAYKVRNQGTWTGSGGLNFANNSTLSLEAGTLTSDGPWSFTGDGSGVSVELSGGTLAGSAALTLPAAATGLTLNGGNLATSFTTAAPVSVTADSTVSGTLTLDVNGSLAVNAGVTLTVAVGGAFTVGGDAVVTVDGNGVLSNYGTVICQADSDLLTHGAAGGVVNQVGATFSRLGGSSSLGGRFVNHGSFDETGGYWVTVDFENSATGTAVIRAFVLDSTWTNAGLMTSHVPLGQDLTTIGSSKSTFSNSGTLNLPNGSCGSRDPSLGNTNTGTLNVAGRLGGLVNTGTVNLTGPTTLKGSLSGDGGFSNQSAINQGVHPITISSRSGGLTFTVHNSGTWTGSGGLNIGNTVTLAIEGGVFTSDGPWSFTGDGSGVSVELSGGTLAGSAALTLPATATGLTLSGGTLAASLTTAAPVSVTANSTVSGTLTLAGTTATGANLVTVSGKLATAGSGTSAMACNLSLNRASGRVLEVATGTTLQNTGSVTFTAGEAMVRGTWQHNQFPLQALPGATVRGDGLINGTFRLWGTLQPGGESGLGDLNILGNLQCIAGCVVEIDVAGSGSGEFGRVLVSGHAEYAGELRANFANRPLAAAGTYVFLTSATRAFSFPTRTPVALAPTRSFSYNTSLPGQFTMAATGTPYADWSFASGLTPGVNDGFGDDPNHDGKPNLYHFAFDTHPLTSGGSDEGKQRTNFTDVSGTNHFSITLPVRKGAAFAGSPSPVATINALVYTLQGSGDMSLWTEPVSEVAPADSAGLPTLRDIDGDGTPDWEYHTFILENLSLSSGFLRGVVNAAP